jgi:hypothetical protein
MAPPPESQLLWVNKDVKSYKQSRKLSAAQAAVINAHSQQQARAARTIASQQALREGSAVRAIIGWRQLSASSASPSTKSQGPPPDDGKTCPTKDTKRCLKGLEFVTRSSSSALLERLVPCICGKDEAVDPFNCAAVKMDSNMHDLIEFYLARLHPVS